MTHILELNNQKKFNEIILRKHRMFHADVMMNAPKDRTLFNYSPKHGWPMLREFLGLPKSEDGDEFPHENKTTNTGLIEKSTQKS